MPTAPGPSPAQLRAFNAVVRSGSFSAAARALGISQPAVTAQVARLELLARTQLLDRGGPRVAPTETGRRLYAVTQRLGDLEDAARAILGGDAALSGEEIRIATASPQVFMPLIAHVHAQLPGVGLTITLGSTGEVVDQVLDRRADIGLAPAPTADRRLRTRPYASHRLAVLLPASHPWSLRPALTLIDLRSARLVMRSGPSMTQRQVDRLLADRGLTIRPLLTLETREAVLEAVASGLGLALVLSRDVPPDPRVRVVPLADPSEPVTEQVMWLASRDGVAAVKAFVAAVATAVIP